MIEERTGDLFAQEDIQIILHQANLFHKMGSGIAGLISREYPEAVEADNKTDHGDEKKLGNFSFAKIERGHRKFTILNLYGQRGIGNDGTPENRNTSYDAIYDCFLRVKRVIGRSNEERVKMGKDKLTIGIPYGISSNLAGGSWHVIKAMIEDVFGGEDHKAVIVRLPSQADLK